MHVADHEPALRSQGTPYLGQRTGQIRDVLQHLHGNGAVDRSIRDRQRMGATLQDAGRSAAPRQRSAAASRMSALGSTPNDLALLADRARQLRRQESRPAADIQEQFAGSRRQRVEVGHPSLGEVGAAIAFHQLCGV